MTGEHLLALHKLYTAAGNPLTDIYELLNHIDDIVKEAHRTLMSIKKEAVNE